MKQDVIVLRRLVARHLRAVSGKISPRDVSRVSSFLITAYSSPSRKYHTLEHALLVAKSKDPRAALAGLFHDVAYWQLDPDFIRKWSNHGIEVPNSNGCIETAGGPDAQLVRDVFGLRERQLLTLKDGLNEYLSARMAAIVLRPLISEWDLALVLACIEGTIPFRTSKAYSPLRAMEQRLTALAASPSAYADGGRRISTSAIRAAVRSVLSISYADLAGFLDTKSTRFFEESYRLLQERDPSLFGPTIDVARYRCAIEKTYLFYSSLNPTSVPLEAKPPKKTLLSIRSNIDSIRFYLQAELIAAAALEGILAIGGLESVRKNRFYAVRQRFSHQKAVTRTPRALPRTSAQITRRPIRLLGRGSVVMPANSVAHYFAVKHHSDLSHFVSQALLYAKREIQAAEFLACLPRASIEALASATALCIPEKRSAFLKLAATFAAKGL
jgi:hypothetical protein